MTDYVSEEFVNKLSLVIRKPQEGKTFICINSITTDASQDIHIVLTMNTLSAGMQFFGRMEEKVGSNNIIVCNSKKSSAGNCLYAKNVLDILKHLKKNTGVKVIVFCAHKTRFEDTLMELFENATDSIQFQQQKRKFKVHIDEAHRYIPENRPYVRQFNMMEIVSKMTGYSASPDPIFSLNAEDVLFNSIYICDIEKEFGMIRSNEYFGVKNCLPRIVENVISEEEILEQINMSSCVPEHIVRLSLTDKERETGVVNDKCWYGRSHMFNHGDELLLLSYIRYILPLLNIDSYVFNYHFVPAYCRKITHYQIAELILMAFNDANVVIINGNGIELLRFVSVSGVLQMKKIKSSKQIIPRDDAHKKQLLEPSFVVQTLIAETANNPTFVTGFVCVSMSVTLVNEHLGNFDNIVMAHQHCKKEDLYQLCRFLCNYTSWTPENKLKIKQTNFVCLKREVYDICLNYENHIEKLSSDYAGQYCSLNEVHNIEPIQPSEKTIRRLELDSIQDFVRYEWKTFEVEDLEDAELQFKRAEKYFSKQSGKEITSRSKPKAFKDDPRFYACSITGHVTRFTTEQVEERIKGNKTWDSYFQLLPGKTMYATRMFIGYPSFEDCTRFSIYIKTAILDETNPRVMEVLEKYGKKRKSSFEDEDDDESSVDVEEL